MKRRYLFLYAVFALAFIPATSYGIPAFAKKYGQACTMCHTAYPKLNDYGQRYRDNGYQVPGQAGKEKTVFEIAPPIALRTTTGLSLYDTGDGTSFGFNIYGFDFLTAGVLHKNISYLLIYTPRIDEPSADYRGSLDGANPSQAGSLESISLIFSNIVQDKLNLRIGRFEPAYHAFSSKRSYYLFFPYEVYSFATPNNTFLFDDNQLGIEATGHFKCGFKYGVGMVNGSGPSPDNNTNKDFYINVYKTFGGGDGQSAGQRIGLFGYSGWQPGSMPGRVVSPTGETNGRDSKQFSRYGVDGSLNWSTLNLAILLMKGVDNKLFNSTRPSEDYKYTGGLVEIDYATLKDNRLVLSALYNWVKPPSYDSGREIKAFSLLQRGYIGSWNAVNVSFHTEYTYRKTGRTSSVNEHLFATAVDFAF